MQTSTLPQLDILIEANVSMNGFRLKPNKKTFSGRIHLFEKNVEIHVKIQHRSSRCHHKLSSSDSAELDYPHLAHLNAISGLNM